MSTQNNLIIGAQICTIYLHLSMYYVSASSHQSWTLLLVLEPGWYKGFRKDPLGLGLPCMTRLANTRPNHGSI
jgi:hypothetical protein